jgi:hypothetical protein
MRSDINRQALQARIREAFSTAEAAAQEAFHRHKQVWPLDRDGMTVDASGSAFPYVKASRRLKAELLALGLITPNHGLRFILKAFRVPDQGITAQEVAAGAGVAVLNAKLSDLGGFSLESRMD